MDTGRSPEQPESTEAAELQGHARRLPRSSYLYPVLGVPVCTAWLTAMGILLSAALYEGEYLEPAEIGAPLVFTALSALLVAVAWRARRRALRERSGVSTAHSATARWLARGVPVLMLLGLVAGVSVGAWGIHKQGQEYGSTYGRYCDRLLGDEGQGRMPECLTTARACRRRAAVSEERLPRLSTEQRVELERRLWSLPDRPRLRVVARCLMEELRLPPRTRPD